MTKTWDDLAKDGWKISRDETRVSGFQYFFVTPEEDDDGDDEYYLNEEDARAAAIVYANAPDWTVQCAYAVYHVNTVTVKARDVMEACDRALVKANNDSGGWDSCDDGGNTYVCELARGKDVDLYSDQRENEGVPYVYTKPCEALGIAIPPIQIGELKTVLAALRYWQNEYGQDGFDTTDHLTSDQITTLCQRLDVIKKAPPA